MIPLSVEELFKNHADGLTLTWLAGRGGEHRVILLETDQKLAHVGYLNLIHPPQIQIIGPYELAYLDALAKNVYQDLLKQIFENENLACIIMVECPDVPSDLLQAAEEYQIPLFRAQLSGENLINYLHTTIARLLAQRITMHGVFMDVLGMGVLITGESGTGKSELALELVSRGHRLIADDATEFSRIAPETISGACPLSGMNAFLEVRGLGILNVQALFGDSAIKKDKYLRLIVHLEHMTSEGLQNVDRLQGDSGVRRILGVDIPEIRLPVAPGRNLAVLLEAAVRNHSLKKQGYNAADEFCELQRQAMYMSN
ncbi:HPr(Ser) kinase/phosphatase [Candidatus Thiomargarita nelsonii]|uniref:HPr kinase/phosphorylase n=1 Tax=Candidatus Thiomargarita nelsonii TaxID=1003181 RepID=A0A0A6RLA9_9GAMM|nr:HPr(Ser) kinase/phosphatase [Candidatus Thiomargarita nelsonii]